MNHIRRPCLLIGVDRACRKWMMMSCLQSRTNLIIVGVLCVKKLMFYIENWVVHEVIPQVPLNPLPHVRWACWAVPFLTFWCKQIQSQVEIPFRSNWLVWMFGWQYFCMEVVGAVAVWWSLQTCPYCSILCTSR